MKKNPPEPLKRKWTSSLEKNGTFHSALIGKIPCLATVDLVKVKDLTSKIVSEHDQEIRQSQTADKPEVS